MTRKDCESSQRMTKAMSGDRRPGEAGAQIRRTRPSFVHRSVSSFVFAWFLVGADPSAGNADSVRIWPTAVVVADEILVSDVCQLRGVEASLSETLARTVVTEAPVAGGTRIVDVRMIRDALVSGGANLSTLIVSGARECVVSRPGMSTLQPDSAVSAVRVNESDPRGGLVSGATSVTGEMEPSSGVATTNSISGVPTTRVAQRVSASGSLRSAVVEFFKREIGHLGDAVDVEFDRAAGAALDLSGSDFEFAVRRKAGSRPDATQVEVDVVRDGRVVQTASLNVRVTLHRQVVTARRPINQGATIRSGDVILRPMTFQRFENLGFNDEAQCVGQRARRFIAEGSPVDAQSVESVPLVAKGQLVTLTSVCGSVRVVSTGRAAREGRLGETIPIRAADDSKSELEAVVVGPGKVEIVSDPIHLHGPLAERGSR